VAFRPERTRLTIEQISLVNEVVDERAPRLRTVVDEIAKGHVVSDAEMDQLSDVVS
jgi:hypothetical protein